MAGDFDATGSCWRAGLIGIVPNIKRRRSVLYQVPGSISCYYDLPTENEKLKDTGWMSWEQSSSCSLSS